MGGTRSVMTAMWMLGGSKFSLRAGELHMSAASYESVNPSTVLTPLDAAQ